MNSGLLVCPIGIIKERADFEDPLLLLVFKHSIVLYDRVKFGPQIEFIFK